MNNAALPEVFGQWVDAYLLRILAEELMKGSWPYYAHARIKYDQLEFTIPVPPEPVPLFKIV